MSAFSDTIAQAMDTIADEAGESVSYWRGSSYVGTSHAVPGASAHNTDDIETGAAAIATRSTDWIFKVAELVINGEPITPRRGDLVKWTVGKTVRVYEVNSETDQLYRFCDRARTRIRVHTKERPAT